MPKPTKKQIEQSIKNIEWIKFNIIGYEEPKPHTFEYAAKAYLEDAINILNEMKGK